MKRSYSVLALLLTFGAVVTGVAQTSGEFHQKYGLPDDKGRFIVRPGIGLTVKFAQDKQPSEAVVRPLSSPAVPARGTAELMSPKIAKEIIDELVPVSGRGRYRSTTNVAVGGLEINDVKYERVTISTVHLGNEQEPGIYSITIQWKK
jgi:hypothetical protein